MRFLAHLAFIAKVRLLRRLLSCHFKLCDGRFGVTSQISHTACLSSGAGTVLGAIRERGSLLLLGLRDLMSGVLIAVGAVPVSFFIEFHGNPPNFVKFS